MGEITYKPPKTLETPGVDPASLVKQLVRTSVEIVNARDNRVQACFKVMATQAVAFAEEMLAQGVEPEYFEDQSTEIPRRRLGRNSYSPYSIESMPMYAIRHNTRYGGGRLPIAPFGYETLLCVTAKESFLGHFALVFIGGELGPEYDSRNVVKPADILNPEHFTTAKSTKSILKDYAVDLGASAVGARKGLRSYERWDTCISGAE